MIEALVRWTEFHQEEQNEVDRLIDADATKQKIQVKFEFSPMCFDMADVDKFNAGNTEGLTVVRFHDSDTFVVKIPYLKFRDLFSEITGKVIMSVIDDTKPAKKKPKDDFEL